MTKKQKHHYQVELVVNSPSIRCTVRFINSIASHYVLLSPPIMYVYHSSNILPTAVGAVWPESHISCIITISVIAITVAAYLNS